MNVDVNTCFGRMPTRRVRYADFVTAARMFDDPAGASPTTQDVDWSLDNLLWLIERHEVDLALTYSLRGKLYDFVAGNHETWLAVRNHPQLVAVATIDPRRHFDCLHEVERCADRGFRVCRFFPDEQGWPVDNLAFLRVCDVVAEAQMGIMLAAGHWGRQSLIARRLCPLGVPVVVTGATFTTVAESMAVVSEYANFFCETSAMHMTDSIEGFVEQIGYGKLMFGSNSPESCFDSALGLIRSARLTESERRAIMWQNAIRHLGLEKTS